MVAQRQAALDELGAENVAGAAGVREQVPHGDFRGDLLVRIIGQDLADGIVQRQLARFDELQRRD